MSHLSWAGYNRCIKEWLFSTAERSPHYCMNEIEIIERNFSSLLYENTAGLFFGKNTFWLVSFWCMHRNVLIYIITTINPSSQPRPPALRSLGDRLSQTAAAAGVRGKVAGFKNLMGPIRKIRNINLEDVEILETLSWRWRQRNHQEVVWVHRPASLTSTDCLSSRSVRWKFETLLSGDGTGRLITSPQWMVQSPVRLVSSSPVSSRNFLSHYRLDSVGRSSCSRLSAVEAGLQSVTSHLSPETMAQLYNRIPRISSQKIASNETKFLPFLHRRKIRGRSTQIRWELTSTTRRARGSESGRLDSTWAVTV